MGQLTIVYVAAPFGTGIRRRVSARRHAAIIRAKNLDVIVAAVCSAARPTAAAASATRAAGGGTAAAAAFVDATDVGALMRGVVEKVASIHLGGGARAGRRIRVRARRGPDRGVVTPNWARSGAVRPVMQVASLELR